ncbi:MAG: hypothetical protein GXO39_02280 [Thermotogae bacterium]|nr:hypothetical protein [Thermotogota bacterium]
MQENVSGYVVARKGDKILYEGYMLNGELFILKSPFLRMKWYEGLLSEEEYLNFMLDNPLRGAYEKYGERFISHLRSFTALIQDLVSKEGDFDVILTPLPENHVREALGFPVEISEDRQTPEILSGIEQAVKGKRSVAEVEEMLKTLGYVRYFVEGHGSKSLEPYLHVCDAIKHGNTSLLLLFSRYTLLIGRVKDTRFVGIPPGITVAMDTLEQLPFSGVPEVRSMPISIFREVGVPVGKIHRIGRDRYHVSEMRHTGELVRITKDMRMSKETVKRYVKIYREWVKRVDSEVVEFPPTHLTKPAWKKMVAAYLDDYPHPTDFGRVIQVAAFGEIKIPPIKLP